MNTKKIKNYFDMRENLILNKQYEDEDELSFEEARNTDEQRAIEKRIADSTTAGFSSRLAGRPAARSTSMGLMTELQKNNLSFDDARQLGMRNHALDYQRQIRERALKMRDELSKKQTLFQENQDTLSQLYDLNKEIEDLTRGEARSTFSTYGSAGISNPSTVLKMATDLRQQYSQTLDQLKAKLKDTGVDAQSLLDDYTKSKNQQIMDELKGQAQTYAGEHPVKSTLTAFPLKVLTAPDTALESVVQHIGHALDGNAKVIDTNAPEFAGQNWVKTARGKVSEDIDERYESNLPNRAYDQALSLGDNVMSRLIGFGTGIPRLSSGVQGITKIC